LTFTYCLLPSTEQADVERLLIAALGVAKYANLRREGLYEAVSYTHLDVYKRQAVDFSET